MFIVDLDEDDVLSKVDTSSPPISTESFAVDLSDIKKDDDSDAEVIVSTNPLDEYLTALNPKELTSKKGTRKQCISSNDSKLGMVFIPGAEPPGIDKI